MNDTLLDLDQTLLEGEVPEMEDDGEVEPVLPEDEDLDPTGGDGDGVVGPRIDDEEDDDLEDEEGRGGEDEEDL